MRSVQSRPIGFTLLEIMVVVAVVGIVALMGVSVMVDIHPMQLLSLDLAFDRTDADSNSVADVLEGLEF